MIEDAWTGILELTSKLVIPDWGALIALIPLGLLVLIVLWLARTILSFATAGPLRRGKQRIPPQPPPGVHPGPVSLAPALAAVGAFLLFWGLVVGGVAILVVVIAIALSLLYWGREGLREYDELVHAEAPAPVVHGGPPPGVHMIGPSFRPILGSLAFTVLFFGLVFGGWLLLVGLLFVIVTLLGWLIDARAEYVKAEEADKSGHLEALPPPTWPKRVLGVFAILVVAALVVDAGILPPQATDAGGEGGQPTEPGGSGPPGSPPPSGAGGDVSIVAQGVAFTTTDVRAPADKEFTIAFDNRDPGTPHDVDITGSSGAKAFDGAIVQGPKVEVYRVPAIAAGSYQFVCSVHPQMTGSLTVE
jgi:plastocyanin